MKLPRPSVATRLFLTCWLVYGLHFATNVVREHYPAFSLAERGTLRVDPYLGLHPDLFEVPGRGAFINNNPGASILAALPYAVVRPAVDAVTERVLAARSAAGTPVSLHYEDPRPNRQKFFREVRERGLDVRFGLATAAIHALGSAPLSAASVVVMWSLLLRFGFGASAALWLALLYAFGTPLFFRTGTLNHNLFLAHATFFAFALLAPGRTDGEPAPIGPGRLAGAGGLAGAGLLFDYSGVVTVVALGLYALHRCVRSAGLAPGALRMAWMVAAAAVPVGVLLAYQAWAFGNPFLPAQAYMPDTELSVRGWNGLSLPTLGLVGANLLDLRFGLLAYGPVLGLAVLAPLVARRGRARLPAADLVLALGMPLALLLFTSANEFARLQWNTGFRMLAPAVPFLFLAAASVLVRVPRFLAIGLGASAVVHGWVLAMVREPVVESWTSVLRDGPALPALTVLGKLGGQYLPLFERHGPLVLVLPVLALAGAAIALLWRLPTPDALHPDRP